MARPKKNTVDYFPHDCYKTKELGILIDIYGNDGYAFYYRLFELLGSTPEHLYKCKSSKDRMYLYKETGVDEDKATKIIEALLELEIIDRASWESEQMIWSQDFVDSIIDNIKEYESVMIKGGEPLFDKRCVNFLDRISKINPYVKVIIVTNVTMLTPKMLEILKRFNQDLTLIEKVIKKKDGEKLQKLLKKTRSIRLGVIAAKQA